MLPSRNHVVVLVSKLHKPTMRALAYARATRPDTLTALTVNVDDEETRALLAEWERHDLPITLTVLESTISRGDDAHRRTTCGTSGRNGRTMWSPCSSRIRGRALVGARCCTTSPALRLKTRLLFQPGVMVTSVPWQLASSQPRVDWRQQGAAVAFAARRRSAIYTDNAASSTAPAPLDPRNRTSRRIDPRRTTPSWLGRAGSGEHLDLSIGAVAHGGHCVARVGDKPESQVVFVRHALPGERGASRDHRVCTRPTPAPMPWTIIRLRRTGCAACPHAGPARCGGCDWRRTCAAQRE